MNYLYTNKTQKITSKSQDSASQQLEVLKLRINDSDKLVTIDSNSTIGRGESNTISINDSKISNRHLSIQKKEKGFTLRDLRSSNGTFLNGVKISEAPLNDSDKIELGSSFIEVILNDPIKKQSKLLTSNNKFWQRTLDKVPSVAKSDCSILILGPSGSGKEVLTRAIHKLSERSAGPLLSVNCSALNPSLIESELFGHLEGSFTGAIKDRKGAFEAARGGVLFLDEIGDLPLELQPKLLRALEYQEITPVGGDLPKKTDVRVIAATHKNLKQKVKEGSFREDLYYRLETLVLEVPSLSDRMEDFEQLLFHFAKKFKVSFSHNCILELKNYKWPGNIRELNNVVKRASVLYSGKQIKPEHLHDLIDDWSKLINKPGYLDIKQSLKAKQENRERSVIKDFERDLILDRLIENNGNQRKTAKELGIPKSTLHDRVNQYKSEYLKKVNDEVLNKNPQ